MAVVNLDSHGAARQPTGAARRNAGLLPGRLRSLFAGAARGSRAEPRVRYSQPFLPGLPALGRQLVHEARATLERAEAVRGRRFTYLGRTVGFPGRIDWEPQGLSDAWRIAFNGLDELMPLGVAAALAQNPEARRRWYDVAAALLREWLAAASPDEGVAWCPAALARRIPNLIHFYVLFTAELRTDPRQRGVFLESLYEQATALAAAVPTQPADHHLVAAGRALFFAGRFFDGMEARGWLETGTKVLWDQLRAQVHEDGGHRERIPAIHAQVLGDYVEIVAFLLAANDDVPIWARKRIKGMADFLTRVVHPDGEAAAFHAMGPGLTRPVPELLAATAIALHEPGLALPGELPGVWPLLILGDAGRRAHAHLPRRREAPEPRALRRTDFYVLPGEGGDVMILDGGTPPADGAGGALSYELSIGGERLIVNPGTAGEEAAPWPAYYRATRAHNVATVDGAEQFTGTRPPAVSDVQWVVRDGMIYFSGTHDGFAHLTLDLRLRHRRRVFCLPGRVWLVCDELLGSGEWDAESFVHFHPEVTVTAACQGRPDFLVTRPGGARARLVLAGSPEVCVTRGLDGPAPQGWHAPRAGDRQPAPVLALTARARLPFVFGYAILPRAAGPATLRFTHDAFRLQATLESEGRAYEFTVVQGDVEMTTRPVARPPTAEPPARG